MLICDIDLRYLWLPHSKLFDMMEKQIDFIIFECLPLNFPK